VLTFLPKNLYEQFSKAANVYFFIIMCMQMIRIISISDGRPAMLLPLLFVIGVSMIKDIFEDSKRHKSDKQENYKETLVYDPITKDFITVHWQEVRVGQIVKVTCDQFFPADMVLA
jgi:magnesium-transporting ATPase (P-type)